MPSRVHAIFLPFLSALAICLALAVAPAAQAAPRDFYGLEAKDIFGYNATYRAGELPKISTAGVGLLRQEFDWLTIETSPGVYKWQRYDQRMVELAKLGIEVMPILIRAPTFRSGGSEMSPPRNYADVGDFGAAVSHRYGPNGSFWTANPTLPRVPIRRFQIWNEPNVPRFWPSGVNPAQYAAMLKAAYPRIKAADPGAEVVTAGISEPQNPCCMALREFVTKMYAAGAKGSFDTLALNPYWSDAAGSIKLVEDARQIMTSYGDAASSLRISEIGWATGGPAYIYNQSETGQAAQLRTLYTQLAQRRVELHFRGVVWAIWRDHTPPESWTQYTGLERNDGSPKPAYTAYRAVATGGGTSADGSGSSSASSGQPPLVAKKHGAPSGAPSSGPSLAVARVLKLRRLLRGLRLMLTCPSACRVELRLTLSAHASRRGGLLAKVTRRLSAGRVRLVLVPTKRARRRLRNIRRTRVFLTARIASQGTALPASVIRTIIVKR